MKRYRVKKVEKDIRPIHVVAAPYPLAVRQPSGSRIIVWKVQCTCGYDSGHWTRERDARLAGHNHLKDVEMVATL